MNQAICWNKSSLKYLLSLGSCLIALGCSASIPSSKGSSLTEPCMKDVEFSVQNHNGTINITGDEDVGSCAVEYEIVAKAASKERAEALRDGVRIKLAKIENGNGLKLSAERPTHSHAESIRINYDIKLPAQAQVTAESHNGPINVENVFGSFAGDTHNGDTYLKNIGEPINFKSHNGDIEAILIKDDQSANIELETHNGNIKVVLAEDELSPNARLATHNGKIDLKIPEECSVKVDYQVHNGQLLIDDIGNLPPNKISGTNLEGKLGEGTGHIKVGCHNGRIYIH